MVQVMYVTMVVKVLQATVACFYTQTTCYSGIITHRSVRAIALALLEVFVGPSAD